MQVAKENLCILVLLGRRNLLLLLGLVGGNEFAVSRCVGDIAGASVFAAGAEETEEQERCNKAASGELRPVLLRCRASGGKKAPK